MLFMDLRYWILGCHSLSLAVLLIVNATSAYAQIEIHTELEGTPRNESSIASLKFLKHESSVYKRTGDLVQVAWFRITNNSNQDLVYLEHAGTIDLLIQRETDGKWLFCPWNFCFNGKQQRTLSAGDSLYFYINPEYYRKKLGAKLKFGVVLTPRNPVAEPIGKNHRNTVLMLWANPIELPNVDNPDYLLHSHLVTQ